MRYHSSPIDTLNLSAENRGKRNRRKKLQFRKIFYSRGGISRLAPYLLLYGHSEIPSENLASLHAKNESYYKGKILLKIFP